MKFNVLHNRAYPGMGNFRGLTSAIIILFLCFFIHGNANPLIVKQKKVLVTVLDLKTGKPVENATVFLDFIKSNAVDVVNYSAITNNKGQCTIAYNVCDNLGYSIRSSKDGLYQCYSTDANSKKVSCRTSTTIIDKEIVLYLTSDVQQLLNYYSSITPHYQIDTLIRLLRTNSYHPSNRSALPELKWEDIPKLLEIANDETKITNFTFNVLSSYMPNECALGIYSMWLIESIRISEGKPVLSPTERFPSLNPIIRKKSNPGDPASEIIDNVTGMKIASKAYLNWWNKIRNMNPEDACKINPLENTGISW
jgi:hypothetical protein